MDAQTGETVTIAVPVEAGTLPDHITLSDETIKALQAPAGQGDIGHWLDANGNQVHSSDGMGHPGTLWRAALVDAHNAGYDVTKMTEEQKTAFVQHYLDNAPPIHGHAHPTWQDARNMPSTYSYHANNGQVIGWMTEVTANDKGGPLMPDANSTAGKLFADIHTQMTAGGTTVDPNAAGNAAGNTGATGGTGSAAGTGHPNGQPATTPSATTSLGGTHDNSATSNTATPSPRASATPSPSSSASASLVTPSPSASASASPSVSASASLDPSLTPSASASASPTPESTNPAFFFPPSTEATSGNPTVSASASAWPEATGSNNVSAWVEAAAVIALGLTGAVIIGRQVLRNRRANSNEGEAETTDDEEAETTTPPPATRSRRRVPRRDRAPRPAAPGDDSTV